MRRSLLLVLLVLDAGAECFRHFSAGAAGAAEKVLVVLVVLVEDV
jgi:hypothetical protein